MPSTLTDKQTLFDLCANAQVSHCHCALKEHQGWKSIDEHRWPKEQMRPFGTLRDTADLDPTFEEFHLNNSRYESVDAPVAIQFYPCNRSDIYQCQDCSQVVLKYVEAGGYYVETRARRITDQLIK
jgi:hypothetical protein